jgi:uncharacterized protein YozE (UPF0346 family)
MVKIRDYQMLLSYFLDALKEGDLAEDYLPEFPLIAKEIEFISNYLDARLKFINNLEKSQELFEHIKRFFDESESKQ